MLQSVDVVLEGLTEGYEVLKKKTAQDAKSPEVAELIAKLTKGALRFLACCERVRLVSKVPDKKYFSFALPGKKERLSRPVNESLFNTDLARQLRHLLNDTLTELRLPERTQFLYTTAISYCCAADLLKTRDQTGSSEKGSH